MNARASRLGLAATIAMVGFFGLSLYEALDFDGIGQWFPMLATSAGLLVALVALVMHLLGRPMAGRGAFEVTSTEQPDADPAAGEPERARGAVVIGWVAAFPILTALIGVTLAVTAWLPAFLLLVAKLGWRGTLAIVVAAVLVVNGLQYYLGLLLPTSVFVAG